MIISYLNILYIQIWFTVQKKCMRAQYSEHERDHYITLEQIGRIRKIVHREFVQLDPNDAHSIRLWAEQIQSRGDLAYYKDKSDPPPEGSNLACSVFMLCIQTRFQMESFRRLGDAFMATHNVTGYTGLQLFTIMVRDHWGHGVCLLQIWEWEGASLTFFRGSCCLDVVIQWHADYNIVLYESN